MVVLSNSVEAEISQVDYQAQPLSLAILLGIFGGNYYLLVSPKFAPPPLKVPMILIMNFGSQLYFWELVWVKQLVSLMGWLYTLSNTSLGSDPLLLVPAF